MSTFNLIKWFTGLSPALAAVTAIGSAAALGAVGLVAVHLIEAPGKAAVARAQAHVATVEATTTTKAASTIIGLTQKSDQKVAQVQQRQAENSHAIDKLPSAAGDIPDSDADAWRHGVCLYDDTDCGSSH
jgi:uncharacterized protein HemX